MICRHCGANIPDEELICPECGAEVQIVPDYNPLEDVLAREVRGSVEGATRQIQTDDIRRYRREGGNQNASSTRVLSQSELDRIREERRGGSRRPAGDVPAGNARRYTGEMRRQGQGTGDMRRRRQDTDEIRRRERQQKRLEAAKRKRRNLLIALFCVVAFIGVGVYVAYQNSYTGMVRKGYKALQTHDYTTAGKCFERAIVKDKSKSEAYTGYAEIYIDQDDLEGAEQVFLTAIETQPTNANLYQAAIDFYVDTEQLGKISALLKDCEDSKVLNAVSDYISTAPDFTPDEGTYNEVQQITLSSSTKGDIYYTLDGTEPTAETGTKYTEPVLLQIEGEIELKAIVVNGKGIPSVTATKTYNIEFPIEDAPAVTPSTGQYTEPQEITITVPEGYTAYYTTDGSAPDPSSSATHKYSGPVDMPENKRTIFNAILVNDQNGKSTEVTTRSYITTSD